MKKSIWGWRLVLVVVSLLVASVAFGQAFYHFSCARQACSLTALGIGTAVGTILGLVSLSVAWIVKGARQQLPEDKSSG